jgi:hypothetical protein
VRPMWAFPFLVLAMFAFSGSAWGDDSFDYNVITPAGGQFSGGDSYVVGQTSEYCAFWSEQPTETGVFAGLVEWAFQIPGLTVLENPTSNLACDLGALPTNSGLCYNDEYFSSRGVVIDDSGGNPLAVMWVPACGPEAVCAVQLLAAVGGGPIDLDTAALLGAFGGSTIVAVGGEQDAIDVSFYNGASASYAFMLTTPEPTSVLLLATLLIGLGTLLKRKFHSSR